MEFRKVLALRGPNVWAHFPVLEAWVELHDLKDRHTLELPGFNQRLTRWLPSLVEHRCNIGERGGFCDRLYRGTSLAHVIEHVTLELQSLAGTEVVFSRTRETCEEGVYRVIVEYKDETLARECVQTALRLSLAAVHDQPFDIEAELVRIRDLAQDICLGPSTLSIVSAAQRRGIPVRRLNEASLVQLGYGAKQRRIMAAETDRTGAIAQEIAQDKELTRRLLAEAGVPVPEGRPVESADDAWEAAEDIGLPVVVKPQDGNQGRGVALNLQTEEQVRQAYAAAREESSSIIVEKYAPGLDYRLLVVNNRLVSASRREAAKVIGDGLHTVSDLIHIENLNPLRGDYHATPLSKLRLDAISLAVLAEQELSPASVPAKGQVVRIRRNANLSTGGTAEDVTDLVHPEISARVVEAAQVVGLDIAGVDVVALDISQPLESQRGVIVEVNAAPGLRMHVFPSSGKSRPVGEAIVNMLFPGGDNGRVPVVAVTGVNGKTTTTRFIAHILRGPGRCVGMTCTDGIYIGDRRIDSDDCSGPKSARAVLANPKVEAAVFETARGGVVREGLGFDRCDVAVVTNIGEGDHLGLSDIDTLEDLAKVKRCIVDVVPAGGSAVLNAADPLVAQMASKCSGGVIFFARNGDLPLIVEHRRKGGRAVYVKDNSVMLATGDHAISLVPLDRVPLTKGGRIGFQVENTLASIAAAWGLGVQAEVIRVRAESFASNIDLLPGRFNVFTISGVTVVVDYGHNASALLALVDAIRDFPHAKRRIVYSTAGDRRDCDLVRQGEVIGEHFDRVILYEGDYLRGRPAGQIMELIAQGSAGGPRAREVLRVSGALPATELALSTTSPDELLVIQADVVDDTMNYLREHHASALAPTAVESPTPAPAPMHAPVAERVVKRADK
jgi:cyanophycin synthetase